MQKIKLEILLLIGCIIFLLIISAHKTQAEEELTTTPIENEVQLIRCTVYTGDGITASGQRTRKGIIAGKREWLHYGAELYRVNDDGSVGERIMCGEILDTGYGIDNFRSVPGGSIKNGLSIDVWTDDPRAWVKEYGDYVYLRLLPDAVG